MTARHVVAALIAAFAVAFAISVMRPAAAPAPTRRAPEKRATERFDLSG